MAALCRFVVFFMLHSMRPGAEREQLSISCLVWSRYSLSPNFDLWSGVHKKEIRRPARRWYPRCRPSCCPQGTTGIRVKLSLCAHSYSGQSAIDDALEPFDSFLSLLSHRALIVVCISVCVVVCKTVAGLPRTTRPQLNYFLSCVHHAISVSYINLAGMR